MRFSLPLKLLTGAIFTTPMTSVTPLLQSLQVHVENVSMHSQGSFRVLNMNTRLSEDPSSQDALLKNILSINADVVCLQEVFDEQAAHNLYESLQNQYAHFYIPFDSSGTVPIGLFIASKHSIVNPQFTPSATQPNDGFFDFILVDGDTPLGHLYTVFSHPNPNTVSNLHQIAEKMQADFLVTEKEDLPFFLCGNLGSLQDQQNIVDAYFLDVSDKKRMTHTLLLQSLPIYSIQIDHKHTLEATQVPSGLLSTLCRQNELDISSQKRKTVASNENPIILCKKKDSEKKQKEADKKQRKAEKKQKEADKKQKEAEKKNKNEVHGKLNADNDGAEGEVSLEHKNKNGLELDVTGRARVNHHGKVVTEVEAQLRKPF